ncbi:RICIN domain-containing protein [Pedobacter arcticus]|uniref:RICIN domain-containing protein n=1 Tax=Pedobacter arcticus TaxID=752140 RepID=UPI000375AA75|nr:RICIN domain-containing protein [Pedobacter arcticus]
MRNRMMLLTAGMLVLLYSCSEKQLTDPTERSSIKAMSVSSAPSAYGTFVITNVSSSKLLQADPGADLLSIQVPNIQQGTSFDSGPGSAGNQKWYLIQQGTGPITSTTGFKIMNVASGMFLEAPNSTAGSQLQLNGSHGFPSQIWTIQKVTGQSYYFIKNANGLVLTNVGGSTTDGTAITQGVLINNPTQYWSLGAIEAEAYRDDTVVRFFRRGNVSNTTVAFDEGKSIPLTYGTNNGKILWITQDAYASSQLKSNGQLSCQFFSYHNSALLQPSITNWTSASTPNITTTSNSGTGVSLLEIIKSPGSHNSTYSWPSTGVEIGSNIFLWTHESANGVTPAKQVLNKIAQSSSSTAWGNVTRLTPNGVSTQYRVNYSAGMVKKTSGDTVYVWGRAQTYFNENKILLARFPTNSPTSWTFWRGNSWASTPDTTSAFAGKITVGSGTTAQQNATISYVNGKYVMMQMDLGFFCDPSARGVYISTAMTPFGPFTTPKLVYTINDTYKGHFAKYYTPSIHGHFVNGKNELLLTYSLNYNADGGSCPTQTCFDGNQDPNFYQVKAIRVPYSLIGL